MKVKVRSLDGDTDYFDIVAGVLQEGTLAPYLFIICSDYMLKKTVPSWQRKEAEDTLHKLLRMQSMLMT